MCLFWDQTHFGFATVCGNGEGPAALSSINFYKSQAETSHALSAQESWPPLSGLLALPGLCIFLAHSLMERGPDMFPMRMFKELLACIYHILLEGAA